MLGRTYRLPGLACPSAFPFVGTLILAKYRWVSWWAVKRLTVHPSKLFLPREGDLKPVQKPKKAIPLSTPTSLNPVSTQSHTPLI